MRSAEHLLPAPTSEFGSHPSHQGRHGGKRYTEVPCHLFVGGPFEEPADNPRAYRPTGLAFLQIRS